MKLLQGLLLHDTPDGTIAVATGEAAKVLNGMIRLSDTAAFILRQMENETTEEQIVEALLANYTGVDADKARADVRDVIARLDQVGLIRHDA